MSTEIQTLQAIVVVSCYTALFTYALLLVSIVYNHVKKQLGPILIWSIISLTCLSASCGALAWFIQTNNNIMKLYLSNVLYAVFYHFGRASIYILFMKQLQVTFNGTKYAISKTIIKWFYFGIAIFIISLLTVQTCYYLVLTDTVIMTESEFNGKLALSVIIIHQIIDFILSFSLIGMFIQKLRILYIDLRHSVNDSKEKEFYSRRQQKKIIRSMSKATILSCVAILSTQLFLLFQAIVFYVGTPDELDLIRQIFLALDVIINSICVVLNFDFADIVFFIACCACDYCCSQLCEHKASKKLSEHKARLLPEKSAEPYKL